MVHLVKRTRALGCLGISPNEKGEMKREVGLFYQFTIASQRKYSLDNFHMCSISGNCYPLVVLCELRNNNSTDICPMETLPTVIYHPLG